MYKYFISFQHEKGYGRCELKREKLITGIQDIESIEKAIEIKYNEKNVSIVNFQLFDE